MKQYDNPNMHRTLTTLILLISVATLTSAQTGTWSGKLEVQGIRLALVFHLDGDNPTMDSPDQGAKGIPIDVSRTATGSIAINIPSIGAIYEGQWLIKQIVGTFTQMGASFPLTLTPGAEKLKRPQTPAGPFPYKQEEVSFHEWQCCPEGDIDNAGELHQEDTRIDNGDRQRPPEQGRGNL